MKPVAIFRHTAAEGAGYFATFLAARSVPTVLVAIDEGAAVPARAADFSGLCFMGGPMSVNDPLPWIEQECALIRDAAAQDIPMIGHCLGGQLMSKAFGGAITRNPVKEIGWGEARGEPHPVAEAWLGSLANDTATVFQWHGETFSIPPGATRILTNDHCASQMFALGPHLGMQCHVEMTAAMIERWCQDWDAEVAGLATLPPTVQTPACMLAETAARLPAMRRLADQLYTVWLAGLRA